MVLKHKANGMSAQASQGLVIQVSGFRALNGKLALGGSI